MLLLPLSGGGFGGFGGGGFGGGGFGGGGFGGGGLGGNGGGGAHRTGTGTQLGGTQARRRNASTSRKMKMRRSLQKSLEIQEKGACRGEDNKSKLTNGSRLRYLVAVSTFFNQELKYLFFFQ